MPITYKIDPAINLLYYFCRGLCAGAEFFQKERQAFNDPLRRPNMKIIFDIQKAEVDISLKEILAGIELTGQLTKQGFDPEMTAVISKSRFGQTFSEVYRMLAGDVPVKLAVFNTIQDAIDWLGLSEAMEQVLQIRDLLEDFSPEG